LQSHPHGIIVCDKPAVGALEEETVNYFLDVERNNF